MPPQKKLGGKCGGGPDGGMDFVLVFPPIFALQNPGTSYGLVRLIVQKLRYVIQILKLLSL